MIVIEDPQPAGLTPRAGPLAEPETPAGWGEGAGAAWRLGNDVLNVMDLASRPQFPVEPDHDPLSIIGNTRYEDDYLDRFVGSGSAAETRAIMAQIDKENEDRSTVARSGFWGWLNSVAAGAASPTTLLPVAGWLGTAARVSRAGRIALTAAEGAAVAGGAVAAQEAILHGAQRTRTLDESVWNVAGASILGGLLSGVAGGLSRQAVDDLVQRASRLPATRSDEAAAFRALASDAGAAASDAARGSGELKGALGAEKVFGRGIPGTPTIGQDPLIRLQTSPFQSARNTVRDLAESPLTLAENEAGVATTIGGAVETQAKMAQGPLAEALNEVDRQFSTYYFGGEKRFARARSELDRALGRAGSRMTFAQFNDAVFDALLAGDVHPVPEVQAAAAALRRRVFDPLKDDAIKAGLFAEDVKPEMDAGYAPRVYNRERIAARRDEWTRVLQGWLETQTAAAARGAEAVGKKLDEKRFDIQSAQDRIDEELGRFNDRRAALRAEATKLREQQAATGKELTGAQKALVDEERGAVRARQAVYMELLADLKRGRPKDATPDVLDFIKGRGGIRLQRLDALGRRKFATDRGQELADALKGSRRGRGVISDKGLDPDQMLQLAIDEGYLKVGSGLDDLVSAVDDTLKGNPAFSALDDVAVARRAMINDVRRVLDERGVDVPSMTLADLERELAVPGRAETPAMAKIAKEIEDIAARYDSATLRLEDVMRLADDLRELAPDLAEKTKAGRAAMRESAKEARALERRVSELQGRADLSQAELRAIVDEVTDTILGHSPSRMMMPADIVAGPRGPLKDRTLRIPTALIRDFVERDPEMLARLYTRTMATDVGLVRKFGSTDLAEQLRKINDEADAASASAKTEAERRAVDADRKRALRDVAAIRDRLRGAYAIPNEPDGLIVRAGRVARNVNYLRLLGGMTVSALPDLARPVMVHGLTRVMGTAFTPFIKGLATAKLAAGEVKLAGTALDMTLDSRVMSMADIMDDYGRGSKFERGVADATRRFGVVSLMAPWNAAMKQFAGIVTQTRVLQGVEKVVKGTASKKEIEYLAANGIDSAMADRIWRQFDGEPAAAKPALDAGAPAGEGQGIPFKGFDEVAGRQPVALRGDELAPDLWTASVGELVKRLSPRIREMFGNKTVTNAVDRQPILIPPSGIKHALSGKVGRDAIAVMAKLDELIAGAVPAHSGPDKLGRPNIKAVHLYDNVASIDGREVPIRMVVRETADGRRYYDHFDMRGDGEPATGNALGGDGPVASGSPGSASGPRLERVSAGAEAASGRNIGHGVRDGQVWWANTEAWTDREAVSALRAAIVRDVDRTIVTPGQDKPLWMSTELGKTIGQFKTFGIASVQRVLLSGLQQRDAAALNGTLMMLALGAVRYAIMAKLRGAELSDDPRKWAVEALDGSGLIGWLMDANNISEKLTRGRVGLSAVSGGQVASRYQSRGVVGAMLGPTFDLATNAASMIGDASAGDWSATDTRMARQMVPLQNLFYTRWLFNAVEDGINGAFGVPAKKN